MCSESSTAALTKSSSPYCRLASRHSPIHVRARHEWSWRFAGLLLPRLRWKRQRRCLPRATHPSGPVPHVAARRAGPGRGRSKHIQCAHLSEAREAREARDRDCSWRMAVTLSCAGGSCIDGRLTSAWNWCSRSAAGLALPQSHCLGPTALDMAITSAIRNVRARARAHTHTCCPPLRVRTATPDSHSGIAALLLTRAQRIREEVVLRCVPYLRFPGL